MLQWIISSSVLIAVILLLRLLLKGRISLRLQYGLWALVLLRLLLPFTIGSSPISVSNFAPTEAQTPPPVVAVDQESADQDQTPIVVPDQNRQPQVEDQNPQSQTPVTQQPDTQQPITQQPVTQAPTEPAATDSQNKTDLSAAEILRILRVVGSVAVGIWFAAVNLRMHRKLRASRRPLEVENCSLPVYVSDQVDTPCLFGLFRPAIYLTEDCLEDESTLRYAIVHEQTHYRHLDSLWALLRCLCLALHWYNPLVWWAALASQKDAELACDESVLRRLGDSDRAPYGRALLRLTCEKRPRLLSVSTTMTGSAKNIKERITMIVKKPKMAIYTLIAVLLITAIAIGCTFTGAEKDATDDSQITTPQEAVYALYDRDQGMSLSLRLDDGTLKEVLHMELRWYARNYAELLDLESWKQVDAVEEATEEQCAILTSSDGEAKITFQKNWIRYERGKISLCWQTAKEFADLLYASYKSLTELQPPDYVVAENCSAEEAVKGYALKIDSKEDHTLIDWGVEETGTDGKEVAGWICYALPSSYGGEPKLAYGIGEYEGLYVTYRRFLLQERENQWFSLGEVVDDPLEELPEDQNICRAEPVRSVTYITNPWDALNALFRDGGEMTVATRLRDKPFSEERRIDLQWHLSSFLSTIDSAVIWTAAEDVDLESFAQCVVFRSADGRQTLTVCGNVAQYEDGDRTLCWEADVVSYFTIASILRNRYSELDHISEDRFVVQGCTPEAAVTYYVEKNHEGELRNNIQGMQGQLHDYALIDYGVDETSGDQGETVGYIVYAFATDLPYSSIIWGQEGAFGIGEYNGMLVRYERFLLRQREGRWYLVGSRNSHPLAELPEDQTICDSTDRSKPYITKLEDGLYTLSDREGTVLFEMSNVRRVPTEIRLTDSVYEFTLQTGTGLSTNWAVFYDSRNNSISETYQYVLGARGDYVIYVGHEGDQEHVIVQNIFDPAAYRQVYALDRHSKGDTSARGEYTADGNMTVRYRTEDGTEAAITVELPKTEQETISYASVWSAALEGSAQEAVQIYAEQFHRQIALEAMAWGMPINLDLYSDFRLIDYSILSIGEDGNSVKFEVRYSYRPMIPVLDGESTPGNVQTTSSTHRLVRAVDGLWHLGMIPGGSDEPSQAPTSPKAAFELVYGEVQQLRMYLRSNRGEVRPILRISAPSYHAILFAAVETTGWEIVNPSEFPSDSDDTIVLLSEDGRHMLSASGKLLLYETEGLRLCWREPDNIWWREEENLTQYLYDRIYNNELNAYRRSPIACDGTAEEAARLYAEREFAAAREEWDNPENLHTNWNILEVSEDGNTIVFTYSAFYTPEYLDNGTEGNVQIGLYLGQEVTLRKMSDGRWYYIDPGIAGTTVQDHFDIVF